jgi:hypothetical protein
MDSDSSRRVRRRLAGQLAARTLEEEAEQGESEAEQGESEAEQAEGEAEQAEGEAEQTEGEADQGEAEGGEGEAEAEQAEEEGVDGGAAAGGGFIEDGAEGLPTSWLGAGVVPRGAGRRPLTPLSAAFLCVDSDPDEQEPAYVLIARLGAAAVPGEEIAFERVGFPGFARFPAPRLLTGQLIERAASEDGPRDEYALVAGADETGALVVRLVEGLGAGRDGPLEFRFSAMREARGSTWSPHAARLLVSRGADGLMRVRLAMFVRITADEEPGAGGAATASASVSVQLPENNADMFLLASGWLLLAGAPGEEMVLLDKGRGLVAGCAEVLLDTERGPVVCVVGAVHSNGMGEDEPSELRCVAVGVAKNDPAADIIVSRRGRMPATVAFAIDIDGRTVAAGSPYVQFWQSPSGDIRALVAAQERTEGGPRSMIQELSVVFTFDEARDVFAADLLLSAESALPPALEYDTDRPIMLPSSLTMWPLRAPVLGVESPAADPRLGVKTDLLVFNPGSGSYMEMGTDYRRSRYPLPMVAAAEQHGTGVFAYAAVEPRSGTGGVRALVLLFGDADDAVYRLLFNPAHIRSFSSPPALLFA